MTRQKRLVPNAIFALVVGIVGMTVAGCESDGDDNTTPTAPPTTAMLVLDGLWNGRWVVQQTGGIPVPITMQVDQAEGSSEITGTIEISGEDTQLPIVGQVNTTSATTGSLDWEVPNPECGSFGGHLIVTSATEMSGNTRLDTLGCGDDGALLTGVLTLERDSESAAAAIEGSPATGSRLGELARAARRMER